MNRLIASTCLSASVFAAIASAEIIDMSYVFNVSLQPAGTLMLSPQANVVDFVGHGSVSTETIATPNGPVTNPIYNDQGVGGSNPLYEGAMNLNPLDLFEASDFATIDAQFSFLGSLHREGIVHRDLACRNVLLSTSRGTFSSLPGTQLILGSDGPPDLRTTPNSLPIRWTAPESLRLYLNGDPSTGAYFEATFSISSTVVPSPSMPALFVVATAFSARRRR